MMTVLQSWAFLLVVLAFVAAIVWTVTCIVGIDRMPRQQPRTEPDHEREPYDWANHGL